MLPPVGAIIVGPCPECQGLVVVFCGQVLALQKDVMTSGSTQERRQHLLAVLSSFLKDRIGQIITDSNDASKSTPLAMGETKSPAEDSLQGLVDDLADDVEAAEQADAMRGRSAAEAAPAEEQERLRRLVNAPHKRPSISPDEMSVFLHDELRLLDNGDYFRAVFG